MRAAGLPVLLALGPGGLAALVFVVFFRHRHTSVFASQPPSGGLVDAISGWLARDPRALHDLLLGTVGQAAAEHALRCASLCEQLANHLAVVPEEVDHLVLGAALHVLPVSAATNDAPLHPCIPSVDALAAASSMIAEAGAPAPAAIAGEALERWDGAGLPDGKAAEATSLAGRILAVACAFDHAIPSGQEDALAMIRDGSGTRFDPVVAGELLHLYREPWPLKLAA